MVLESILVKKSTSPFLIFLVSAIISLVSIFISYTVFKESTGLFTVVIISLTMVPFINRVLRKEEIETEQVGESQGLMERHWDVVEVFIAIFLGMTFALSTVFIMLPDDTVQAIFNEQIREVKIIQGNFSFGNKFFDILVNNVGVLMLSFLFSFLIGTGAILILAWNASVLSTAIGIIAKSLGGIEGVPIAVLTFLPHGTFELIAYFVGAIAGGLISASLMNKKSRKFVYILKDSITLIMVSFLLLVVGAFIETIIMAA
ncbi:hypothetical protein A3K63_03965 [Candidatus Micrarchaeota archaeon RBG_16_49_10]|nr:MAG: hypothetical protein A3K63_03965 [Candidatus Micrarchaeota archaeon RBG_16_49_10]